MSMSTHVVGFRPADEQWKKMKGVFDACRAAGVEPPDEVMKFFNHQYPDDGPGVEVNIDSAAKPWSDDCRVGFEVDIQALPKGVRFLRFYNSW